MDALRNERIQRILANFTAMNGNRFVGIKEYTSVKSGEVANFVINANANYGRAVTKEIAILESLTEKDFSAIAEKYNVDNHSDEKYGSSAPARLFLTTGKIPKEGTKARIAVEKAVKTTKMLATVTAEMVQKFKDNQNEATRSNQSIAQEKIYERLGGGVKWHIENERLHIFALNHSKDVIVDGEYNDSIPNRETAQKNAITSYCKYVLDKVLPTTKWRNFVVEAGQLAELNSTGETFTFI
jgi:signal recognition particle subunit SEC65